MRPPLSIAAIIKNEAQNLPQLFDSLSEIREALSVEVVIADTGSTDNSVPLSEKEGATVVHWKWNDDFSQARNFGLKHCTGDWILWLDADDVLNPETSRWLIDIHKNLDPRCVYLFKIVSPHRDGSASYFLQTRLFPNQQSLEFRNPIHESLSASIREAGLKAVDSGKAITHHGYEDPEILKEKIRRNKEVIERLYLKGAVPVSLLFSLARTAQTEGDYGRAEKLFRDIIADPNCKSHQYDVYIASHIYLGQTLGFAGNIGTARRWFENHLKLCGNNLQFLFEYGKVLVAAGDKEKAKEIFIRARELPLPQWSIPTDWAAIQSGLQQLINELVASKETSGKMNSPVHTPRDLNKSFGTVAGPLDLPYPKNTLSVVMIVKNEKDNIRAAVESFRPFTDEIIVNDTGSTDGTQDILKELGVIWFQTKWREDFSLARNQSIEKATSSWILWLDADDRVPQDQVQNFLKLKTAPLDRVFGFQVINTHGGQPIGARFMQLRMFPNHPKIRFERKVHEQMVFSAARLGLHSKYTETTIYHTGYENDTVKKEKALRNLRLAQSESHLIGVDPTLTMSCGDSHYILEEWDKGIEMYQKALAIPHLREINKDVYRIIPTYIGLGYQRLQKHTDSLEWLEKGIAQSPQLLEPRYYKAVSLRALGRNSEARDTLQKIIDMPLVHSSVANQYDGVRIYSFHTLAELLIEDKNYSGAAAVLELMHQHYTQVVESWSSLGLCYYNLGEKEKAGAAWKKAVNLNPARTAAVQEQLRRLQEENEVGNDSGALDVSLCMIVKNESRNLGACLDSVRGLFREMIIVDTGSADGTQEIIQRYGAELVQTQWENDFSQARNLGIDKATSPWIFWLDADDVLSNADRQKLAQLVKSQTDPGKAFGFLVQNSSDRGITGSLFNQIRLFPNRSDLRFTAPVHEQILPALEKAGVPVEYTSIKIIHTGYGDEAAAREKQIRNKSILERQIAEGIRVTPVTYYTLAHACMDLGEHEKAAEGFIRAAELAEQTGTNPHILQISPAKTATALANLARYEEALNVLKIGLTRMEPHPETVLLKAQVEEKVGNTEEAFLWYSRLLEFEEKLTFIPVDYGLLKIKALEFLGRYWMEKGQRDLAIQLLKDGIKIKSGETFDKQALEQAYEKFGVQ